MITAYDVEQLRERTVQLLKAAGVDAKVIVMNNDPKYYDPSVEFDGTGIGVFLSEGDKKTISGIKNVISYTAYRTEYHAGVWRYPDGSGEPPDDEIVELGGTYDKPDLPIEQAIKALIEFRINDWTEAEAEKALDEEWKQEEQLREKAERELGLKDNERLNDDD